MHLARSTFDLRVAEHPQSVQATPRERLFPVCIKIIQNARQYVHCHEWAESEALWGIYKARWWVSHTVFKQFLKQCSVSSVQSLSLVWLFVTPWITARQASLSITNSWSSLRLTSIESVMPSSHLILCLPLLLLPPIPPSISLFQRVNSSHEVAKVLEFQL